MEQWTEDALPHSSTPPLHYSVSSSFEIPLQRLSGGKVLQPPALILHLLPRPVLGVPERGVPPASRARPRPPPPPPRREEQPQAETKSSAAAAALGRNTFYFALAIRSATRSLCSGQPPTGTASDRKSTRL